MSKVKPIIHPEMMCWFCTHFRFWEGSPGYSEMTPGSEASFSCGKGHKLDSYDAASLKQAETCKDFDLTEAVKKLIAAQPTDGERK